MDGPQYLYALFFHQLIVPKMFDQITDWYQLIEAEWHICVSKLSITGSENSHLRMADPAAA